MLSNLFSNSFGICVPASLHPAAYFLFFIPPGRSMTDWWSGLIASIISGPERVSILSQNMDFVWLICWFIYLMNFKYFLYKQAMHCTEKLFSFSLCCRFLYFVVDIITYDCVDCIRRFTKHYFRCAFCHFAN